MRNVRQAIANFHRVSPAAVEVFEDDAEFYESRRAARLRAEGKHRRSARKPSLRDWWDSASPLDRFGRIWWWAICGLFGFAGGVAGVIILAMVIGALT